MRLSTHISLLVMGSAVLSMLLATIYFSFGLRDALLQQKLESLASQIHLRALAFETHIHQLKADVALISKNSVVRKWLAPEQQENTQYFENLLVDEFHNFLETRQHYFQIRLLSPDGAELIRLDKDSSGIKNVGKAFLQDKSERYYFDAIRQMTPNTTWLSPIDLNHEFGRISQPETPTIRAAKLLTDYDDAVIGIIIINMDTGDFLRSASQTEIDSTILIVNGSGDFLVHPNPNFTFAVDRKHSINMATLYPELNYQIFFSSQDDVNPIKLNGKDTVFRSLKFAYDELNPENNIRIIQLYEAGSLARSINSEIITYFTYALWLFLFIVLLSILTSRHVRRRLQNLNTIVELVKHNKKATIEVERSSDEVDDILLTLKEMLNTIDDREASLVASEARIQTILNTVLNGVITLANTGDIVAINHYGAEIFDYKQDELIGKSINMLLQEDDAKYITSLLESAQVNSNEHAINTKQQLRGKKRDDSLFPISLVVREIFLGNTLHFVGAIDDISERLDNERRLSTYSKQLERSNRDLEQFAYMASHDLQEPARKMESFSSLLLQSENLNISDDARDLLGRIKRSARRMRELIVSVLSLSRIEKTASLEKHIDLNQVLNSALEELQALTQSSHASITSEHLPTVSGDKTQLAQLFINLIGNALKFVDDNDKPVIHVKTIIRNAEDNKTILKHGFSIEDNGIGIPPENRARIFKPFERLNRGSKYEGFGIGLALCQRIVEFHGGEINIEDKQPKGTRFLIILPVALDE